MARSVCSEDNAERHWSKPLYCYRVVGCSISMWLGVFAIAKFSWSYFSEDLRGDICILMDFGSAYPEEALDRQR